MNLLILYTSYFLSSLSTVSHLNKCYWYCCSVMKLCLTMRSWPHELQHTRIASLFFTLSLSLLKLMSIESVMPSNPTISSSVVAPFSSYPQSFPASESFSISPFTSCGKSVGASTSAAVLPMNIQDWWILITWWNNEEIERFGGPVIWSSLVAQS